MPQREKSPKKGKTDLFIDIVRSEEKDPNLAISGFEDITGSFQKEFKKERKEHNRKFFPLKIEKTFEKPSKISGNSDKICPRRSRTKSPEKKIKRNSRGKCEHSGKSKNSESDSPNRTGSDEKALKFRRSEDDSRFSSGLTNRLISMKDEENSYSYSARIDSYSGTQYDFGKARNYDFMIGESSNLTHSSLEDREFDRSWIRKVSLFSGELDKDILNPDLKDVVVDGIFSKNSLFSAEEKSSLFSAGTDREKLRNVALEPFCFGKETTNELSEKKSDQTCKISIFDENSSALVGKKCDGANPTSEIVQSDKFQKPNREPLKEPPEFLSFDEKKKEEDSAVGPSVPIPIAEADIKLTGNRSNFSKASYNRIVGGSKKSPISLKSDQDKNGGISEDTNVKAVPENVDKQKKPIKGTRVKKLKPEERKTPPIDERHGSFVNPQDFKEEKKGRDSCNRDFLKRDKSTSSASSNKQLDILKPETPPSFPIKPMTKERPEFATQGNVSPVTSFLTRFGANLRDFPSQFGFEENSSKNKSVKTSKTFIAFDNKSSKTLPDTMIVKESKFPRFEPKTPNRITPGMSGLKKDIRSASVDRNLQAFYDKDESGPSSSGLIKRASGNCESILKPLKFDDAGTDLNTKRPASADTYKYEKKNKSDAKMTRRKVFSDVGDNRRDKNKSDKSFQAAGKDENVTVVYNTNEKSRPYRKGNEKVRSKAATNFDEISEAPLYPFQNEKSPNFKSEDYVGVHLTKDDFPLQPASNVTFTDGQVDQKDDRVIKNHLRELAFYIVFLIIVTMIALGMVSVNMFYFTDITARLFLETPSNSLNPNPSNADSDVKERPEFLYNFEPHRKTLQEASTHQDFWTFAESTMIDLFYWEFWYAFNNPETHVPEDDKKMFYENQLLGVPRIRQVRVRNDSCLIHPNVKRFFDKCYDYYTVFSEETRPIKEGMEKTKTKTAWVFTPSNELNSSYYWGKISTYGGGGYYLDFDLDKEKTKEMIKELKENMWISRGTRAVFVDFTIYNANANLFCICKIVLEFPPMGGLIPKADFSSVKLIRYLSSWDFFILGCEFVFVFFVIYYTIEEIIDLKTRKVSYFTQWWNYVDLLSYSYVALSVVLYFEVEKILDEIESRIKEHIYFGSVGYVQIQFNNITAVLVFFSWVKLFKYLDFNKAMIELSGTLSRSMKDIFGFALMFFTVFIAFAQLAYLLFGAQVKDYSNVWSSSMALLQTVLGEFEYKQIEEANRILGPIFYVVYVFFIFFVLLNMFLAIINDSYAAVKSEVSVRSHKLRVNEYIKRGMLNVIGCSCCGLDEKLQSKKSKEKKMTYAEIKESLKRAGFSDLEIEMFFAKYDIDVNRLIDEGESRRIIEDLELKRLDFHDERDATDYQTLKKEIERLNDRIAEMQRSLIPIIDKVDILLRR